MRRTAVVKLGLGEGQNEHSFIAAESGVEYELELPKLDRENISADNAKGDATDEKAKPRERAWRAPPAR